MFRNISLIFFFRCLSASGTILLTLIVPLMFGLYEAAIFLKGFTALYLLSILSRVGIDLHLLRESSSEECNGKFYIFGKEGAFLLIPLLLSFSFFSVVELLRTVCSSAFLAVILSKKTRWQIIQITNALIPHVPAWVA